MDVARGLAVLGMFASHIGPPQGWLATLTGGRSAALFAVLAGLSLALLSGGATPVIGRRRRAAALRIAVRAVVVFVLGLALTAVGAPVMVILTSYGVLFLLSIPLLRLRSTALAVSAAVLAVVAPLVSFFLRSNMEAPSEIGAVARFEMFTSLEGVGTAFQHILLTGAYPVLTWMPFMLVGMALGRLDLRAVRGRLVLIGAGLALAGYGISWLAMNVFGGRDRVLSLFGDAVPPELVDALLSNGFGTVPTSDPVMLLSAGAHSGTPFEIFGATGAAMLVIGLCLLAERFGALLLPIASVGALALTSYAGHILVLAAVKPPNSYVSFLVLALGTLVFATLWRALLGRGPLEWALHRVSSLPAPRRG
ncbi:heparan-alpha-glucosaminide N-acetyltransferase domain-containing protein [Saccharopolyspora gloriosae]|uniref:heparan-alpha-glucosaminide N-acetyltransferase domain-containing protein n=1 Tax=Saccharopolyspora gloriosae TaxID=455344 RepID=UPI001FB5AA28|nr:heparan-alpha-glucosaminide N-acetyltransferase domain-containing protein [Saccharopolyspora gloriosae]